MPLFFKRGNAEPAPRAAGFLPVTTQAPGLPKNPLALTVPEWRTLLWGAWNDGFRDNLGLIAAGVAFFALMALFPALSAFVAFYGLIGDPAAVSKQIDALVGILPAPVIQLARDQLGRLVTARGEVLALHGVVSAVVALWGAQQGARSFLRALTIINERTKRRRFFRRYLVGGAFTLGALGVAAITIFLFALAPNLFARLGANVEFTLDLLRWPVLVALVTGFAMALYRWGPNRKAPRWVWVWPGALMAAVAWLIVSAGFSVYVDAFTPMRAAYRVFSGVFVLMLWLFLAAYIFLLGAEINSRREQICAVEGGECAPPPPKPHADSTSTPDPLGAEPR